MRTAVRIYATSARPVFRTWERIAGDGVGPLVFGGPGRGHRRLNEETTLGHRQGLERRLVLLLSLVLVSLCGSPISQIIGHYPPALEVLQFHRFPEIHTRVRDFKALVLIEDPLYVLGTGHVYNSEAERMAPLIPQNLCKHDRSKRGEGLTEHVIAAKIGQPADMNMGTHVNPSYSLLGKN
jgi:hypothetical protein